jgi:histidinol dehydrogenase
MSAPTTTVATRGIPRIDTTRDPASATLALQALRDKLSVKGDVVSPRGRELTERVFGAPLTPLQVVDRICDDVQSRGLPALVDYTARLDNADVATAIRIPHERLADAHAAADPAYLDTIRRIRHNVHAYQSAILPKDVATEPYPGVRLGLRYRPLRRVGICVPGGAAAYPSTLLMTVVPAQVAGVREIAVVAPPTPFGADNDDLLAACHELGVSEVYRIGGAQAVAALAYGVEGLPAVDKIVGPGNLFVALAKKHVYGAVDIDSIAGPSEVVLIADDTADPHLVAADLLSQAEHSPGASILLTWDEHLIDAVAVALETQMARLERGDLARASLEQFGALVRVQNADEAVALSNQIAPEHLHVATRDADALADQLTNAGAIFLGHFTPVALGDYAAGPSHVLPTGGTARWASGLSSIDFLKRTSLIQSDRDALAQHYAHDIARLATVEGLTAHRLSVTIRTEPKGETRS